MQSEKSSKKRLEIEQNSVKGTSKHIKILFELKC